MFSVQDQIKLWDRVVHLPDLLTAIANIDVTKVQTVSNLRKKWSAEEVSIAIELTRARTSAKGRLDNADTIVSDLAGVQQTSSSAIAKWKAKRFAQHKQIVDVCCGVGGDLMYLPANSIGVDIDPLRCWMAKQNTGKEIVSADVRSYIGVENAMVLLDPSRRDSQGRRLSLETMQPTITEVQTICKKVRGGCVKLSPAIELEDINCIGEQREVEYIEDRGRVRQGIVWFNELTTVGCTVRATSLTASETISGEIETPRISSEIGQWIYEPNPALERAKLHGTLAREFGLWEPAHGLGLLFGNELIDSTWFNAFEVLACTALRLEKVAPVLKQHGGGEVEVKTRDGVVDPDEWQKKLQRPASDSNERLTVFAIRLGKKRVALIARRVTP